MHNFRIFAVLLNLIVCQNLFGQNISNIDFDYIKKETQDSLSLYYYPSLLTRYLNFDSTLTEKDFSILYYGNVFYDKYNPYGNGKGEKEFMDLYKKGNFEEAIPFGKSILIENPINLEIIFKMLVCYHKLEDKVTARKYAAMYFPMLNAIYKSGDGKSHKTAYVVVKVADEYEILKNLELYSEQQALVGTTDVLTIAKNSSGNANKRRNKKIKKLYFNVSFPLGYLSEMFKKKE